MDRLLNNPYKTMKKKAARSRLYNVVRLGDIVGSLLKNRISHQQSRFESIAELWERLLPAELYRHCKIIDISGGRLKVEVDSALYAHELRLCSSNLLEELRRCPRARINEIKFVVSSAGCCEF